MGIGYGLKDLKDACGSFDAYDVEVRSSIQPAPAAQHYQASSQALREILEVAQSTITSWSSEVSRNGFLLKKVGRGK